MHHRAGDTARAIALLERTRAAATPGDERATVLVALAGVRASPASIALYYDALAEARDDALRAMIHTWIAIAMKWGKGIERAVEHAELAVRTASRVIDATVRRRAISRMTQVYVGRGIAMEKMHEAMSVERTLAEWPLDEGPTVQYAYQLFWTADIERGREVCQELVRAARARNDPAAESDALWFMGFLAWRAGDWDEAERYIADSLGLGRQLGTLAPPHEFQAAVIAAHRGRVGEARAIAHGAIARETARRRTRHARGGGRRLRASGRAALDQTGSRRARPHRRPLALG